MTVQELIKSIHEMPPMTEKEKEEFYSFVREKELVFVKQARDRKITDELLNKVYTL